MNTAMYTIIFGILGIIVAIILWLNNPMDFKHFVRNIFKNIFAKKINYDLNIDLEKKVLLIKNKELLMDKKHGANIMANKNNEKMLNKVYLIASIVLTIVLIIYYTTPWIKGLITDYKEIKGDVTTNEIIIENSEKMEEDIRSLTIEDRIEDKETINLKSRILVFIPETHAGKERTDN